MEEKKSHVLDLPFEITITRDDKKILIIKCNKSKHTDNGMTTQASVEEKDEEESLLFLDNFSSIGSYAKFLIKHRQSKKNEGLSNIIAIPSTSITLVFSKGGACKISGEELERLLISAGNEATKDIEYIRKPTSGQQ